MAASLAELVACLKRMRQARAELDDRIKQMKDAEKDLEARILLEMSAQGVKSVNLEGVARVTSRDTYHYEIADIEKLSREMYNKMLAAIRDGKPLSDALLFQQRLSKSNIEDTMAALSPEGVTPELLDRFGVRKVEEKTLSLTKA